MTSYYGLDSRMWGQLSDEDFTKGYKNGEQIRAQVEHCLYEKDIEGSATLIVACLFADKTQKRRSFQALGWFFAGLPKNHGLPHSFLNEMFHQSLLSFDDFSCKDRFLKEGVIDEEKLVDAFFHEDTIDHTLLAFYLINDTGPFSTRKAHVLNKAIPLLKNTKVVEKIKNHLFNTHLPMSVLDAMLSNPVLKDEAFKKLDQLYQKQMEQWMGEAPHFLSMKQKTEISEEINKGEKAYKTNSLLKKM